jgi:hypothetical protein
MGGGGGEISRTEADVSLLRTSPRAPRRWNRGAWVRFVLAISPTVVFAILGYLQTH